MRRPMLIAAVLTSVSTTALASETIAYRYDARGRLVQVARSGTVNHGATTDYAYDKADNRTAKTVTGGSVCLAVVPRNGGYRLIPCGGGA